MRTSLLLVTYNREKLLKQCIQNIENYASGINELIIVDNNSSDETLNYLKKHFDLNLSDDKFNTEVATSTLYRGYAPKYDIDISLISLDANTGGSGGFYEGVKYFRDVSNNDWLWGMDDDAFVQDGSYEELVRVTTAYKDIQAFWSNCNNDKEFDSDTKPVLGWMFVGFCLSKFMIKKIGLPVSDYFIYHDDSEYAMRIIQNGYKILKIRDSIISHGDLNSRNFWEKKFLGITISFPEMSEWKLYYYIRNDIHKHSYCKKNKIKRVLRVAFDVIKITYLKPSFSKISFLALTHGIVGRKGKIISP